MRDSTHYFGAAERQYEGLDLLSTAVLVLDARACIVYANQSAELLLDASRRNLQGQPASRVLGEPGEIERLARDAAANLFSQRRTTISLRLALREPVLVQLTATSQFEEATPLILELSEIEQRLRQDREERQLGLSEASRELLRNLAHEIKNPLGGIRGAAQLLDAELRSDEEREYTRVIIAEADRLHTLVDRLLAPHRRAQVVGDVNIHEVCERVRLLILAQHPAGLEVERDYDTSIPEFRGDREQLIQAVLNIVRNAVEALADAIAAGRARVLLRTRVVRQCLIGRTRHRLALELLVRDNGPGVPEPIRDRIFDPLVSGRDGGTGLGLTLAQDFVLQHQGTIECDSTPGRTDFRILIPLP